MTCKCGSCKVGAERDFWKRRAKAWKTLARLWWSVKVADMLYAHESRNLEWRRHFGTAWASIGYAAARDEFEDRVYEDNPALEE